MVKIGRFVGGKVGGVAIGIGILLLAAYAARRTNAGETILGALRGFGTNVGQGITAPFQGILEGLTLGGQGLGESAVSLSEGFQKSVTGTLFGEEKFFFGDDSTSAGKASIDDLAVRLAESFSSPSSNLRQVSAPTTSLSDILAQAGDDSQTFIERIGNLVNPFPAEPTEGLYVITFKTGEKSGVLPLSQAALDFHRNAGNTVTRVN